MLIVLEISVSICYSQLRVCGIIPLLHSAKWLSLCFYCYAGRILVMATFGGKFQVEGFMRVLPLVRSSFGYLRPYLHHYLIIYNYYIA